MTGRYQSWLQTITSRVNTINGRKYSEDPTIMAWDLINEPRCENCKPNQIAVRLATLFTLRCCGPLLAAHFVRTSKSPLAGIKMRCMSAKAWHCIYIHFPGDTCPEIIIYCLLSCTAQIG